MAERPKIMPCLWFDDDAEDAMRFYAELFDDFVEHEVTRFGGKVLTVVFEIAGQRIMGLNGGPKFRLTEAISLFVRCDDQAEVDRYWSYLTADGGKESMCGWLEDKYGLSWQIVPDALPRLRGHEDREGARRATEAMLKMRKIDIAGLEAAFRGEA